MRALPLLLTLALIAGCDDAPTDRPGAGDRPTPKVDRAVEDAQPAGEFERSYPADTTPPPGTRYPCPFSPLPPTMDGIPAAHHAFADRFFGVVVKAIHARLRAELALAKARGNRANDEAAATRYETETRELAAALRASQAPPSLAQLPEQTARAVELQGVIYAAALRGSALDSKRHRESGGLLRKAYSSVQGRFPKMSEPVKKSIYHHFCALDISGSTQVFELRR